MSQSCDYFQDLIFRLPDDDLTADEKAELLAHLRSCPDCKRVFDAFADVFSVLKDDMDKAPAVLAAGVMDRIHAAEAAEAAAEAEEFATAAEEETVAAPAPVELRSARTSKHSSRRRWTGLAAAACLVLIAGGGFFAAKSVFRPKGAAADMAKAEAIVLEEAAEAPVTVTPLPEPVLADTGPAEEPVEAEAAAEESFALAAAEEPAEEDMILTGNGEALYTWMNPAQVPAGREADFEALIAAGGDRGDAQGLTLVAAVEYRGVIYEFLTDGNGALYWQDAAESVYPLLSPGTESDLWDIIDG